MAKTTTKKVKATFNRRVDGVVKQEVIILTKKGKKYYREDGTEYRPLGVEVFTEI